MKKTICAAALAVILVFCAMIHGAAADKKGVRLCFIVDAGSIAGCAEGTSLFDEVLGAVIESGQKTAFFFDDENINYDADYATAMMKAFASGMPVGVFDEKQEGKFDEALIYQKYITRSSSRMVLTNSATIRAFSRGYSVYATEIAVSLPDHISAGTMSSFENALFTVRISEELTPAVVQLFNEIKQSGIYIITPTETGFSPLGMEE